MVESVGVHGFEESTANNKDGATRKLIKSCQSAVGKVKGHALTRDDIGHRFLMVLATLCSDGPFFGDNPGTSAMSAEQYLGRVQPMPAPDPNRTDFSFESWEMIRSKTGIELNGKKLLDAILSVLY